ncbi:hypothetical protein DFH07DRAFT_768095 [Mycena maculata]|uniref:Uncharacterized protein n=1 Tax=Mycena maculata TaxID=230809 RepID=A0AAD7JWM1_9AGAR|nr:hypothetical protein DFH07DRAFT_782970 [Mycena maculata]KAJ7771979.1 hypothetical protein DFH07DRAFT_768095 [Mycena maculata]
MPFSGNRRPVFNAMLLANASFFYYFKRKKTAAERNSSEARISVLESVVEQLRSNQPLSDADLARLKRLAAPRPIITEPELHYEPVLWKDILLGRAKQKRAMNMTDEYLDKIAEELEKSGQGQ